MINILIKNLKNKIKIINKTNVVENFQNNKFMKVLTKIEELRNLILNGITKEELDNNYDYSQITDMSYMFHNCKSLKEIPLLNTSNVVNMNSMFSSCEKLENKPNFDMSKVKNNENMYYGCTTIEKKELDIENKANFQKKHKDEKDLIKELNNTTIDFPNLSF